MYFVKTILITLILLTTLLHAEEFKHPAVDKIIEQGVEPDGVVFELVTGSKNTWGWAAPMVKDLSKQLKQKYPEIDIAIVSHGYEQFQLTKSNANNQKTTISILKDLVKKDDVDLHVCGTHSSWYNVPEEDYIDIVDVTSSGPARINDYQSMGYKLIKLYKIK